MKKIQFIQIKGTTGSVFYHKSYNSYKKNKNNNKENNSNNNIFFVPYAAGYLHAYLLAHEEITKNYIINNNYIHDYSEKFSFSYDFNDLLKQIDFSYDIFCFCCYSWNLDIHLKLAKIIKINNPKALIIFGGTSIEINPTNYTKDFLLNNKHIDILVHGFGETILVDILKNISDFNDVKNISFIKDDNVITNETKKINFDEYKKNISPYYPINLFENIFENFLQNNKNYFVSFLFETNRGCPFECTFCEWGKAIGNAVIKLKDIDFIEKEIESIFKTVAKFYPQISFGMFIIDSNYGLIKRDVEIYKKIVKYKDLYNIKNFGVTKSDSKILTEYSIEIEKIATQSGTAFRRMLAVQTFDKETLQNIKRPYIDKTKMISLRKRNIKGISRENFGNNFELIFSLPGKYSYKKYIEDLNTLMDLDPLGWYMSYINYNGINTETNEKDYIEKYKIISELIPTFNDITNIGKISGIVQTDSFTRDEFKKMWIINILWKLVQQDQPYNILSNVIYYLHKKNKIKFGDFMDKFYNYTLTKESFIGNKLKNIYLYIHLIAEGYYSNKSKKVIPKFFADFIMGNFNKYLEDINNFIKLNFNKKDSEYLIKMIKITIKLNIGRKKYFYNRNVHEELYGLHGIFYSKFINLTMDK